MTRDQLINLAILQTVPQLYEATAGPKHISSQFGTSTLNRYSHIALTPDLNGYLNQCRGALSEFTLSNPINEEIEFERVQQICASIWLQKQTGINNWHTIFDYFTKAQKRTVENTKVNKSIVIDRNYVGNGQSLLRLDSSSMTKVIDWLGSSTATYLRVNEQLEIVSFDTVTFDNVEDPTSYIFLPGFVYPIASQLKAPALRLGPPDLTKPDILVSTNQRGDLVVASRGSILASRRKGHWTIYDTPTLKNSIRDCIKQGSRISRSYEAYGLACTLFQVLFDMSFKRHGGLILVDDTENSFSSYTFGGIRKGSAAATDVLFPTGCFNTISPQSADIRKLLELSSVDGAVLFSVDGYMKAFGTMITSTGTTTFGARTAAAKAAVSAGAVAFKVSSDGDISIYFQTKTYTNSDIHEIRFL
jgi:hypothetical protein